MKRLLVALLLLCATTLSGAPSYKSSIRPIFYDGKPGCTAWQVEEHPGYWVTAGHCYVTSRWEEVHQGVSIYKRIESTTIDGHQAEWVYVETGSGYKDIGVLYTPGYDIPGLNLAKRDAKLDEIVTIAGYRLAKDWDQTNGQIKNTKYTGPLWDGAPDAVFIVNRLQRDETHKGPARGSSGSPILDKKGRVVGILIGGVFPAEEQAEAGNVLPPGIDPDDMFGIGVDELRRVLKD